MPTIREVTKVLDPQNLVGKNYREPDTEYAAGTFIYALGLDPTMILQCKTAGTTSSLNITITNAREGDAITDGTAVWSVVKVMNTVDFMDPILAAIIF